ncbi:hypothetical protein F4859DRAFT_501421 [Xylaria cf. heliscus]|nr:hypothetical protein F4859DRAFT_501421 [Xylaria cf. heliscus]
MRWFNEQIKQDIITQSQHLLESFVELLHMHSHAEIEPFNLTQVDEVLNGWLENDAVQNPAYRRRYLITQQDIHLLFSKEMRHFQTSGAPSMFDRRHDGEESCSLALSCEQEDDNMRTNKENTNLRQDTSHGTPSHAPPNSNFSTNAEVIEFDKPGNFNKLLDTDAIVSQHLSDTHLQDADADDAPATLRETIIIDSSPDTEMRRIATQTNRRSRKYKVHDDLELSTPPPKNYICRRCHEPGHWIQHCPTNLDPRYDRTPAHDYRCNFCGTRGDHFATLCPKNPHERSLTKQREHAIAETREPRTPTGTSQRHYQHRESSSTRLQDRYRSYIPEQRAQNRYRSRTPEYCLPQRSGTDDYDSETRNEDDRRRRHKAKSNVSPYTARVRLTREFHMISDHPKERGPSSRSWDDSFRFERRSSTPSPLHRCRSPSAKKRRRGHRDLDKVTKPDEGRLAYDDESEIVPKSTPFSPIVSPQRHMSACSTGREEVILFALSSMVMAPDDIGQAETKAEDFLGRLATEFMLKTGNKSRSMEANTYDDESRVNSDHTMKDYMGDINFSNTAIESEPPAVQTTPCPKYRLVQCPPFRPEIVSLFKTRENPIVNGRANRKTASQMMETSDNL